MLLAVHLSRTFLFDGWFPQLDVGGAHGGLESGWDCKIDGIELGQQGDVVSEFVEWVHGMSLRGGLCRG